MIICVFNLGCKVNQYECDVIAEKLGFRGYTVTTILSYADAYILNTCAVTAEAERKSRQAVSRCRAYNPDAKIFVIGCASQNSPGSFTKDGVVYIAGTANKLALIDEIGRADLLQSVATLPELYENIELTKARRTRAFVKIQDGCNNFCSYCIIPFLRGRSRSRSPKSIENEIRLLAESTHEIVLTGIDVMNYGKDINTSLAEIIKSISDVDVRIRLGSVYAEKIDNEFLDALFSLKKFCPHFHLSLQSGDNGVLRAMNRHYTAEEYFSKIELIKSYDSIAAITTDIIVGFPTEDERAFENTRMFVKQTEFSDLHIFPYSSREGTVASRLKPLNKKIVNERKNILSEEKKNLHDMFLSKNLEKRQEVLIEERTKEFNVGYSRNYIRVYTKQDGEIVYATPNKIEKDGLTEV